MAEDWAAVAAAINDRVRELGWRQSELSERSHVSQAIVREIQHHVVERRRSARTLEALSTALGWPPQHLHSVLYDNPPTTPGGTASWDDNAVLRSRLDTLERQLSEIAGRLDEMHADLRTVADHVRKDP